MLRCFSQYRVATAHALLAVFLGSTAGMPATAVATTPSEQLQTLGERYFQDGLALNPVAGSYALGEARFDGLLTIGIAPAEVAKDKALQTRLLRDTAALPVAQLNAADQLSLTLLRNQAQAS